MPGVFDQRLNADIRRFGIDAFTPAPEMTAAEILEAPWREKQNPALLY